MKRPSRWRNRIVLAVVLLGTVLALPNLASDPALHISSEDGSPINSTTVAAITARMAELGVGTSSMDLAGGALTVRLGTPEEQRLAADSLADALPRHVIAFTSEPRLPAWMRGLGLRPISLGLDLTGGVQFVYEVDLDTVTNRLLSNHLLDLQQAFREAGLRVTSDVNDEGIVVDVPANEPIDAVRDAIASEARPTPGVRVLDVAEQSINDVYRMLLTIPDDIVTQRQYEAMQQNILTLRNRVNELGLSEPVVVSMGTDRILVQIPGARDPAQIRRILGSTATLEWRLQDVENDVARVLPTGRLPTGSILREDADGNPVLLRREIIASGDELIDARFAYVEGMPVVTVRLNRDGADRMQETTQRNVGRPLGVLLIEETRETVDLDGAIEYQPRRTETVIFLGRIEGVFSSDFVLSGLQPTRAQDLAVLMRSGALAAPIYQVGQSTTVSPTLGQDNIRKGRNALIVGFLLVVAFMAAYYRVFGLIANLALLMNLVLMLGLLSLLGASLTLTGIAGIVLTVGMAVDANVLIFERIREELRNGNSPQASIREGYQKAFSTIADANVTTLIAAMILFMFGTGPIKGFAITLSLGIMTSMFTAIVGTRAVVDTIYVRGFRKALSIGTVRPAQEVTGGDGQDEW